MHPRAKEASFLEAEDITSRGKGRRDLKTGNARESGLLLGGVEGLDMGGSGELFVLCRKGEHSFL